MVQVDDAGVAAAAEADDAGLARRRSTPTLLIASLAGSPRLRRSWFSRVPDRTSTEKVCGAISI